MRRRAYRPLPPLRSMSSGVVDASAECMDCEWKTWSYKNALAIASVHARRHGHQVHAEQVVSVTYNRRKEADGPAAGSA